MCFGEKSPDWLNALVRINELTRREHEVFLLLADGLSNQEMADNLFVSERTVRAHLGQIMIKLRLSSRLRVCLAAYVYRTNSFKNCQ